MLLQLKLNRAANCHGLLWKPRRNDLEIRRVSGGEAPQLFVM